MLLLFPKILVALLVPLAGVLLLLPKMLETLPLMFPKILMVGLLLLGMGMAERKGLFYCLFSDVF